MTAPATIDSAELRDLRRERRDEIIDHLDLEVVDLSRSTTGS